MVWKERLLPKIALYVSAAMFTVVAAFFGLIFVFEFNVMVGKTFYRPSNLVAIGIFAASAPERICSAADVSIEAFSDQLDAFIEKAMALDLAPGVAVAVVQGDENLYQKGHGYADIQAERKATADTVFYIASSTKSFTGLAAAIIAEKTR